MDEIEQDLRGLRPAFLLAQLAGLTMVVTMSVWTGHYLGGFAGQTVPELNFNWHPLLLTISLIYLYGNGILIYRLARQERKQRLKVAHATVMACSTLLSWAGVKAAWDSHSLATPPIPHTYSLHSWCGILTLAVALLQWLIGCIAFLWPGVASHLRTTLLPLHVFVGIAVFVLACVTALLGITEKSFFSMKERYKVCSILQIQPRTSSLSLTLCSR